MKTTDWASGLVGDSGFAGYTAFRPVPTPGGWIATGDRMPTAADGFTDRLHPTPLVVGATSNPMIVQVYYWNNLPHNVAYWHPLANQLPVQQIKIGEYTVEFRGDGVQVGCTYVTRAQVVEVAKRLGIKAEELR